MIISLIAAMGKNRVIGANNKMMWRLPKEWAYFKETTLGHCIVTGRKNFHAQGRPLPGRTNIVVTRDKSFTAEGVVVVHSIDEAIKYAKDQGEAELFICGGGQIYSQTVDIADKIYLTVVDYAEEGEVYFPEFDESKFHKNTVQSEPMSDDNKFSWTAFQYVKKSE